MTEQQAIALFDTQWWLSKTAYEIVAFQLFEDRLCVPFDKVQQAVVEVLGRAVWTHEFADPERLRKEFLGNKPAPSMEDIINMIPEYKRIVVGV